MILYVFIKGIQEEQLSDVWWTQAAGPRRPLLGTFVVPPEMSVLYLKVMYLLIHIMLCNMSTDIMKLKGHAVVQEAIWAWCRAP